MSLILIMQKQDPWCEHVSGPKTTDEKADAAAAALRRLIKQAGAILCEEDAVRKDTTFILAWLLLHPHVLGASVVEDHQSLLYDYDQVAHLEEDTGEDVVFVTRLFNRVCENGLSQEGFAEAIRPSLDFLSTPDICDKNLYTLLKGLSLVGLASYFSLTHCQP